MSNLPTRLRELHAAKKPYGSTHGQMVGCESYRLIASGNAFEWLIEAAEYIEKSETKDKCPHGITLFYPCRECDTERHSEES
jgi:hypothetical protein